MWLKLSILRSRRRARTFSRYNPNVIVAKVSEIRVGEFRNGKEIKR